MAGFRFCPTDTDLLKCFLKPKINGEAIPCNFIVEKQIYGPNCNPWDVLDEASTPWIPSGKSKKTAYVFTRLNSSSSVVGNQLSSGSNVRRKYVKLGGCGSWKGTTRCVSITDNNKNVLGVRRELIFRISDVNANNLDFKKLGQYKLHEYVLSGCDDDDYALCRITFDASKIPMVDVSDVICSIQNLHVLGKRKSQYYCSTPNKMLCT